MCYNTPMLYFDNASTTKIREKSLEEYNKASELFYNPSAMYGVAGQVKQQIEDSRQYFLKTLKGKANSTLIFTGSATESNNAVLNTVITRKDKKYIFSAGEHSSVHNTAKHYKELGYNVVFIPLLDNGGINEQALYKEVDETTALVSIIHVSNETGAINNIKTITETVKAKNAQTLVHSDGVQALGKLDINLKDLGVDFYTVSAHKINGPKGIGALYIANPNKFKPFIMGGGQELSLRAGTENVPAVMAFKTALENLSKFDYYAHKQAILSNLSGDYVLVSNNNCVNNIISLCFKGVRGETLQHMMESKGYLIGTGSACNSKVPINRVLEQIVPKSYISGAVRISFGAEITIEDCKNMAKELSISAEIYTKRINK